MHFQLNVGTQLLLLKTNACESMWIIFTNRSCLRCPHHLRPPHIVCWTVVPDERSPGAAVSNNSLRTKKTRDKFKIYAWHKVSFLEDDLFAKVLPDILKGLSSYPFHWQSLKNRFSYYTQLKSVQLPCSQDMEELIPCSQDMEVLTYHKNPRLTSEHSFLILWRITGDEA